MEYSPTLMSFLVFSAIIFLVSLAFHFRSLTTKKSSKAKAHRSLPPGPPGWPIIGNILDSIPSSHEDGILRTLASLSQKYGPVFWLELGTVKTMVVCSADAAMDMFKNHDVSFASRYGSEAFNTCNFSQTSMTLAPYGQSWRLLRRLCITQLFTNKIMTETADLRMKCMDHMISWISEEASKGSMVEISDFVFLTTINLQSNLFFSHDVTGYGTNQGMEFLQLIKKATYLLGLPNVVDFLPLLRWLDPQGIRRRIDPIISRLLEIISGEIDERVRERYSSASHGSCQEKQKRKNFLDMLLESHNVGESEPQKSSHTVICTLILELFVASETSGVTIEWAMALLFKNPTTMKRLKAELHEVVGWSRKVEENDIKNLPYLRAVIKETLRLYPPVPLLVPRKAIQDVEFMGYIVPKNTQVLVNAYAIGRDPNNWEQPLSFKPERFLESSGCNENNDIGYRGSHYKLIPFGAGRRMCVGYPLGKTLLHLIHSFDWILDGNDNVITPEAIDTRAKLGTTLSKVVALRVIPKPIIF
ncbi:Cytochrome P450 [Quillaja saponaria]|uniref:Cytochrome P450 n=1 Tax=Quillaja saponaria TaxID=32244 RepID=A0AAD7KWG5_QUISA|nr:Cytochrome P450 [Quillaja saponaria]